MAVRIALIGCGLWGEKILSTLLGLNVQVLVIDVDQQRCLELAAKFPVQAVPELRQIGEVSGFIVATPASTHAHVIGKLLPFQVPIFVEKPLTDDPVTARQLEHHGRHLVFAMHIWNYHPGVQMLADISNSGELGATLVLRTVRKNWTSPRTDVDSIWTLVPHDLSIAKTILGQIPEPVLAHAELLSGRAVGMLAVLGRQCPQVIIDTSNRYFGKRREIRLHCEKGIAVLPEDGSDHIMIGRESTSHKQPEETRRFEASSPLQAELEAFVHHLSGGPPPPTDFYEGLEVVEIIASLRRIAGISHV